MDENAEDSGIVIEDLLCPVAMVNIIYNHRLWTREGRGGRGGEGRRVLCERVQLISNRINAATCLHSNDPNSIATCFRGGH